MLFEKVKKNFLWSFVVLGFIVVFSLGCSVDRPELQPTSWITYAKPGASHIHIVSDSEARVGGRFSIIVVEYDGKTHYILRNYDGDNQAMVKFDEKVSVKNVVQPEVTNEDELQITR